jgi:hypothetical protein
MSLGETSPSTWPRRADSSVAQRACRVKTVCSPRFSPVSYQNQTTETPSCVRLSAPTMVNKPRGKGYSVRSLRSMANRVITTAFASPEPLSILASRKIVSHRHVIRTPSLTTTPTRRVRGEIRSRFPRHNANAHEDATGPNFNRLSLRTVFCFHRRVAWLLSG